jgi:hypothetical protein
MLQLNARAPCADECGCHCKLHDVHWSHQCLINNVSVLDDIVKWVAVEQCSKLIAHCLVHTLANGIQLQILAGRLDILDDEDMEETFKCAPNAFTTFTAYTMHWARATRLPTLDKFVSHVVQSFVVYLTQFDQI